MVFMSSELQNVRLSLWEHVKADRSMIGRVFLVLYPHLRPHRRQVALPLFPSFRLLGFCETLSLFLSLLPASPASHVSVHIRPPY